MNTNTVQPDCPSEQIGCYLDGELDQAASLLLESHLEQCSNCAGELAEQRRLLGDLNSVLTTRSNLPMPEDFARIVATNAEADMSGLRERAEHGRALQICALLAVASLALLGVAARTYVFTFCLKLARLISAVLDVTWTTIYDAATSLTIISRVLSRRFVPNSQLEGILLVVLALAVLLLSRLIASYHRTRFID